VRTGLSVKSSANESGTRLYQNGIIGWPREIINANNVFPWNKYIDPLIAIIDTGVNTDNPYLRGQAIRQITPDGNNSTSENLHGTMVAGLIVANGDGWSTPKGVLPKASVLSIQIGSDNGATTRDLALAILKADFLLQFIFLLFFIFIRYK
jgi:hypothetical protein